MKYILVIGSLISISPLLIGCNPFGDDEGVCTGFSDRFNTTYCYNDFTKNECKDYDNQQVNFVDDWHFHEGQSCSDRGLSTGGN